MVDLQIVETIILVLHVLAALAIIGLVLIQHGKGADMGSGFGSGASATVFGSGGAGNFLSKSTSAIAIAFFLTSFGLAYFAKTKSVSARDIGIPAVIEQSGIERKSEDLLLPSLENFDFEKIESEMPENELPSETVVPVE
jgi:preprotein translocase subunit SecG